MVTIFKAFQLADILAALLVLREAVPPLWRWALDRQSHDMTMPVWLFSLAALAAALIPVTAFWRRIFDHAVLWLGYDPITPVTSTVAMILLFCVLFWFHHLLRYDDPDHGQWRVQHRLMGVVLIISFSATVLEQWQ